MGSKATQGYILDNDGNKIYDTKKRQYQCKSVPSTNWNEQTKAEEWRSAWATAVNIALEKNDVVGRIDHRSYERQGICLKPTIHLGVAASAMEKRGIRTKRGDINREIEVANQKLRRLKARLVKLQDWLKEESANTEPPTLADVISNILSRREQSGQKSRSSAINNLKAAANMLNFLTTNSIKDMAGLDSKLQAIKHQEDYTEAHRRELILYEAAERYLKGVMNGKTSLPIKEWKAERDKLTADKKRLNGEYVSLKNDITQVEKIRRNVNDIMREETHREQPTRREGMEL